MSADAEAGEGILLDADVVVVGAGRAGLAAAREAAAAGLEVVLVDENPRPGGQIDRRRFGGVDDDGDDGVPPGVRFLGGVECHGFVAPRTVLTSERHGAVRRVRGRAVVVATGGLERVIPLPGWTRPGVLGVGAAQTFLKGSGTLPYRRVLVAGTGPLLLAGAVQLVAAGVEVAAVVEGRRLRSVPLAAAVRTLAAPEVLAEGLGYLRRLHRAGVPVITGAGVAEVEGAPSVTGAQIRSLDADWSFRGGPVRHVACDAVLLGHGFSSAVELVAQAGARLRWDAQVRAWRPERDRDLRTSVGDVLAVGDCAGVAGARVAELEGALAGRALAARLTGRSLPTVALRRRLRRLAVFRRGMDAVFRPGPGVTEWAADETCLCRCEGSTVGEVRRALGHGVGDSHGVTLWTRAGMGPCQGRVCGPAVTELLAARGVLPEEAGPPRVRFPVRPLLATHLTGSTSADGEL